MIATDILHNSGQAHLTTLRDAALHLAAKGFRVFPLSPGSKVPALERDWQAVATTDPARIDSLWVDEITGWQQPFNVGVALDPGTIVVDVDVRDGKPGAASLRMLAALWDELPPTYTVATASGGEHRYFRVDERFLYGKQLAEGIDLKTAGGYVVGPGSIIGGKEYSVSASHKVADLPSEYVALAERAPGKERSTAPIDVEIDTESAVTRAVEWLRDSAPDSGTFKVAARVKDFGVSEEMAVDLLCSEWAEPRSLGKDRDHISVRVANAYRYGQSPIGVASPEAEFEAVEVEDRRPRGKLYFDKWEDNALPRTDTYLIDGWFDLGTMVVTYGESNAGKSNIALSQCVAVATGQPWCGHKVRQGMVVYVAAEGGRGFRKRIEAYKKRFGLERIPFALVPCPIDLLRPTGDTKALIELVRAAEVAFDQPCALIVIDTLARALAGGNENAPDDMGALVMHCDRIRLATKATLNIIHHSGKVAAAGARGHSSLRAATDTEIEILREDPKAPRGTVQGKKQRDMDVGAALAWEYEVVALGVTESGEPLASIVTHVTRPNEFEDKVPAAAMDLLEVLRELQSELSDLSEGVTWTEWFETWKSGETNGGSVSRSRATIFRLRLTLSQNHLIRRTKAKRWVAVDESQNLTASQSLK